jgi:hypothetical protein
VKGINGKDGVCEGDKNRKEGVCGGDKLEGGYV